MPKRSSKLTLIAVLLAFAGGVGVLTDQVCSYAVRVVGSGAGSPDATLVYAFAFSMMITFVLFAALPVLMIIAYRGLQGDLLHAQVMASLSLCALDDHQLQSRLREFEECNSLSAFLLPSVVNLLLLCFVWQSALLPSGIANLLARLATSEHTAISFSRIFSDAALHISPLTWALLGAYFYTLTLIIRRWMLSDLTTSLLWKINVRLAVTFILGMLLISISTSVAGGAAGFGPDIAALAFLVGIVPDLFLRWLSQQVKRLGGIDAQGGRLFAPSDLQSKIDGLSFWQVDRLAEEGIESVHDLAMKEIPSLLIKTRFDAPLLLNWVDRALLCTQVDDHLELFKRAHLYTGTDLMAAAGRENGIETLLRGLTDAAASIDHTRSSRAADRCALPVTAPMILNIMSGLANGPNLRHLTTYRANVNNADAAWRRPRRAASHRPERSPLAAVGDRSPPPDTAPIRPRAPARE